MPRIRATIFGSINVIQELPEEIARNPWGILESPHTCPLAANRPVSYRFELPIDPATPLIFVSSEVTLFGDNNQIIFCYRIDTQMVA
jgi:hypothetical protein